MRIPYSTRWCLIFFIFLNLLPVPNSDNALTIMPEGFDSFLYDLGLKKHGMAEVRCHARMAQLPPYEGEGVYCNRTWDGWLCWDDTPAGVTMHQSCPDYYPEFDTTEVASKHCFLNGTWSDSSTKNDSSTNFSMCYAFTHEKMRNAYIMFYIAITGHSVSLLTLFISLAIFVHFKSLGCQRVTLHKHMFLTYVLNSISILIQLTLVVPNKSYVHSNPVSCKILSFINQYMMSCNYFWMLCEGIYLHTLIVVSVFMERHHMKWYFLLGWGLPIVPTTIYCVLRGLYFNDNCWLSTDTYLLYIIHGPVMAALVVNFFFLLNIIRVLIKKMKEAQRPESHMYLKAVRATLFLVPLLGAQFVVLPWRPHSKILGLIYDYVMHVLIHFQGFFVSVIYCFYNSTVRDTVKRHWQIAKIRWQQNHGSPNRRRLNYFRMLMAMVMSGSSREDGAGAEAGAGAGPGADGLPMYIYHPEPRNNEAAINLERDIEAQAAIPLERASAGEAETALRLERDSVNLERDSEPQAEAAVNLEQAGEAEPEAEIEAEAEAAINLEQDSEPQAEAAVEQERDSEAEAEDLDAVYMEWESGNLAWVSDADTSDNPEQDSEAEAEAALNPEQDSEAEAEAALKLEHDSGAQAQADAEADAEADAYAEADADAEADAEAALNLEPNSEAQAEAEAAGSEVEEVPDSIPGEVVE